MITAIAPRTIARRAAEFRAEQSRRQTAREQVADLVQAMRENDFTSAEMIQALATQALIDDPHLADGLNIYDGAIAHEAVAKALGKPVKRPDWLS